MYFMVFKTIFLLEKIILNIFLIKRYFCKSMDIKKYIILDVPYPHSSLGDG